jgi:rRNA-processing protein FCF1
MEQTYVSKLIQRLRGLQDRFIEVLNGSQLERYRVKPNPYKYLSSKSPPRPEIKFRWAKLPPEFEREQNKLIREFNEWHQDFSALFSDVAQSEAKALGRLKIDLNSWVKFRSAGPLPSSKAEVITSFKALCQEFENQLDKLSLREGATSFFVVDTSALIECPDIPMLSSSLKLNEATIIVPSTTISELDELKTGKRDQEFRRRLSSAIKNLKQILASGNAHDGLKISEGVTVKLLAVEPDFANLPAWLDQTLNDDRIIATVIELQIKNPSSSIAIISNDINMHNKASMAGIPVIESPDCLGDGE